MRVAVLLVAAVAACAVVSPCADGDLASRFLAAKTAAERADLARGHDAPELAAALDAIAKTADAGYAAKNYPAALNAYEAELALAGAAKRPFVLRRIGLCNAYLGQNEAALDAYRAGVGAAETAGDDAMLAENLHGVANILQRVGRLREAVPFSERELALTEKAGQPEPILHALTTYAEEMSKLGRSREALPLKERAVELSRRSSQPGDYAAALGNLASAYMSLGDYETGLRLLQSLPSPGAIDFNLIAIAQARLHRDTEAEASYRAAIATAVPPNLWTVHAAALLNLGILRHEHSKLQEARASVEQSLAMADAHRDPGIRMRCLAELAGIEADAGNVPEALQRADEALSLARQSEDPSALVDGLVAQAHAFEAAGRNSESDAEFAEAIDITEGLRADAPASAAGLQGELDQWLPTYKYAVDHQINEGNAAEALRLADRAKARVLLDMLDRGRPGLEALADPAERAGEQQALDEVARARRTALTKPSPVSKAELEAALRKEEDFSLELYARHPELLLQRAAPPDIRPENLAMLAPDGRTAVLSYFVLQNTVVLFVIRAGDRPGSPEVKAFRLPDMARLETLVRSFRAQIAARDLDYRVTARALYNAAIAPAAGALRGAERWILSPDGSLWDVPFQALMDPQGRHVLETHTLSYTPSLSVLMQLRGKPAVQGPLLAVAPIAESVREAGAIAALYGPGHSTLLAGNRASAALFRASAGDAAVIHIASHAETETNHPLESFLLLSQEKGSDAAALTARDVLGMRLRANLVVLSACETARGRIGQGEGVMGLGWAMIAAGARATVLSQWKVDSAATGDLMIDLHRRLAAGKADKAEALRQASLDTMRSPGRLHPFYWAAFIVLGDGR
jgi:CHAT domain-containing protein